MLVECLAGWPQHIFTWPNLDLFALKRLDTPALYQQYTKIITQKRIKNLQKKANKVNILSTLWIKTFDVSTRKTFLAAG